MKDKILVKPEDLKNMECEKQVVEHWRCKGNCTDPFEITVNENTGMINVKDCYGSYGSTWYGQRGKLKAFLASCDDDYIFRNFFGAADTFWGDETKTALNKTVRKKFKEGRITFEQMEEVRIFLNEQARFEDGYQDFIESMVECPNIEEVWEYDKENIGEIYACGFSESTFGYTRNQRFFIKKIWPYVRHVLQGATDGKN